MKYLREIAIIFGITMAGELLNYLLPLPVPAGVYGLFILLGLLCAGIVKVSHVAATGNFLLDTMPLMFIPAGAGLLNSTGELNGVLIPLVVITVVSTLFVMVVTGKSAEYIIRNNKRKSPEQAGQRTTERE